ncbi:uncharacterized protein LOC112490697 isoform X6 [Ziziphus jujuba]|uniref:Uncharacterized protein LOC112490697 isoform X6 n=1 Tax=Ziziphus jujuba TaxID=326968 RepID=A0ABM3IGG2_ZIZJJ|nr:uncharacterized protein LOC112490697 isoform X6 [Ziziphus jujuba]
MRGINLTHLETGSLLSHRALFEASLAAPFEASSISHHHPLRSIVDLASPSPSKHLAGLDLILRRKKLDFGGKLPFEAFLAGEFIFCCILPLFHRSAIITWKQQYSSKDYAEVGVLTILSSSIAETSRRGWRVDNFKQQYSRNITQRLAC